MCRDRNFVQSTKYNVPSTFIRNICVLDHTLFLFSCRRQKTWYFIHFYCRNLVLIQIPTWYLVLGTWYFVQLIFVLRISKIVFLIVQILFQSPPFLRCYLDLHQFTHLHCFCRTAYTLHSRGLGYFQYRRRIFDYP